MEPYKYSSLIPITRKCYLSLLFYCLNYKYPFFRCAFQLSNNPPSAFKYPPLPTKPKHNSVRTHTKECAQTFFPSDFVNFCLKKNKRKKQRKVLCSLNSNHFKKA